MTSPDKSDDIAKFLEDITPEEHVVLKQKFGITLSKNSSPEELVEAFSKITHEKIRNIEREALTRLRGKGAPDESK